MGPWSILIRAAAKTAGKKMGGTVKVQTAAGNKYLHNQSWSKYKDEFATEHHKDVHDLITNDSGVAPSWVEKLIDSSTDTAHLKTIKDYLLDPGKSYNLTRQMRGKLLEKTTSKMELIQDHAILKSMIGFIRDHGGDLF